MDRLSNLYGKFLDALAVIARTTAMRYKGTQKDIARIGRELNVEGVVALPAEINRTLWQK